MKLRRFFQFLLIVLAASFNKLLLEKAGVQCMLVEGRGGATVGQGLIKADHAWNIVRIDGEYYHVDAAWNDALEEKDNIGVLHNNLTHNIKELIKKAIDKCKPEQGIGTKLITDDALGIVVIDFEY